MRALWIEIPSFLKYVSARVSRPVRALWIEISSAPYKSDLVDVEAREGLVD